MAVAASQVELWSGGLQAGSDKTKRKTHDEWGEDKHKVLQLMLGQFNQSSGSSITTLDLLGSYSNKASDVHQSVCKAASSENSSEAAGVVELDQQQSLPSGWEKCLDLKTGAVYYVNLATGRRGSLDIIEFPKEECDGGVTGSNIDEKRELEGETSLELKLNICAPENEKVLGGKKLHTVSSSVSSSSSSSSCVSSERGISKSMPIITKDEIAESECMVLVGCPSCLMYVMASGQDPKCPRCRSSVLLDFPTHANSSSKRIRTF